MVKKKISKEEKREIGKRGRALFWVFIGILVLVLLWALGAYY
tara:strand:+ start:1150 stop:1275 length:126 start_codon:yes stop_codon:yes gene_type:complete